MTKFFPAAATFAAALIVHIASMASSANAAVDYDPFDYSAISLAGQDGGTGWNDAWVQVSTGDNGLSNDSVSLSYPVPFESPLTTPTTSGSRVFTGGLTSNTIDSRLLTDTIDLSVAGNVRYVSALFRKNRTNGEASNDNILLEFFDASTNRRWGLGIVGGTDTPWLNANGVASPATPITVGDTYFMVAKIVAGAGGTTGDDDTAFLKVFGTGYGTEVPFAEPTTWDATVTEKTGALLDRIRIRIDAGNEFATPGEVDEIRVASSWSEVVGGPAPPSLNGDFNNDGNVDAGDYVTWRKNNGTFDALPNDNGLGTPIGQLHYDLWRANFGNPPGSGSSLVSTSVPEPATWLFIPIAAIVFAFPSRRYGKGVRTV